MEEVRQQVQEEGREARNLVAFHVAVDTPGAAPGRVARKPPRGAPPPRRPTPRSAARLRSASAGRDKRSELRARYWALLFGDLQRSVGEIYNTVEAHENQNECQEVILVLENYTRDFKALGEWFRLKWEYDNTPPPQRPQSLAWEIRKTDFVRPESRRTHSTKSSPSVSGKNSPCLSGHNTPSGKNSPNLTGKASPGSGKISPRILGHPSTSPKGSIEFFSNKIASKIATKPEPTKVAKETRLSDIKEKDVIAVEDSKVKDEDKKQIKQIVEVGKAKESPNVTPKPVMIKTQKRGKPSPVDRKASSDTELCIQAKSTIAKLEVMENEFLVKNLNENAAKNENMLNQEFEHDKTMVAQSPETTNLTVETMDKISITPESPAKSEDNFGDISNESSKSCDEKPDVSNNEEPRSTNYVTVSTTVENVTKNENLKKKDVAKSSGNKDGALKVLKEIPPKDKVTESNDTKKETSKKITKESITKPTTTDDSTKDKTEVEKIDWAEDCEKELYDNEENFTESQDEAKATTNESKPPELNNVDTKDSKKDDKESKKSETKQPEIKVTSKPAYSQAAAKPKLVTIKAEVNAPVKTALYRSKTVVEIRPNSASNRQIRQNANRNQKSKCSYPFNLTTGRTSLFDTPGASKVIATKRPIARPQLASGDAKNQIKPDLKTRPPRPNSLKINEQGDKQEKLNPAFEKVKDCDEYSSSDTVVTQIDISRIESSESLKTIVPEGYDVANSIEVLNVDGDKTDNDGWLTVKSRRLSRESKKTKSHWTNRFHQPSATTSLPTLNMIESPKSETNPIVESKLDRAKSEQPQNKPEKVVKSAKKEPKNKESSMIRQKSDVTGLKTRSSRNKALKKDKNRDKKDSELTKNRLHSSLESLTTGLARSQESTEGDTFDFDKWKAEFMNTFKYLEDDDQMTNHDEILMTADPSEMSEIAEMTSQIEENERKISLALDFQSEADQKKLCQEEDLLNRQIMELQQVSDIELDTETDDTETDAEIVWSEAAGGARDGRDLAACLQHQYGAALEGLSCAERLDMLGALEELVARDPGRAQQLHAKLSAGVRRASLPDVLRRLQAKQARAARRRRDLTRERAARVRALLARVAEVKMAKDQLIDEKRNRMERRLQKAAENRDQHLKDIVRKAHDEEEKLREIAFIKQLEAENRRHEFLEQCRALTTRLREMRRERLLKLEQKAAREAAVGARRQALEAARKQHVESLLEKRKVRDARREELKEQRRQERDDAAREKAEGVKSRLSALAAAAELEADALRSRIRDKQDASQQRLESHLQAIRVKATGPRLPTTSESQEGNSKETINEADEQVARLEAERKEREKQKVLRKKARKLKQKIIATSSEEQVIDQSGLQNFLSSPSSLKLNRLLTQLSNIISPLLHPDYSPVQEPYRKKKPDPPPETRVDPHFRYDFEDKLGKKKKKARNNKKNDAAETHKKCARAADVERDRSEGNEDDGKTKKNVDLNDDRNGKNVNDQDVKRGNANNQDGKKSDKVSQNVSRKPDGPRPSKASSVCSSSTSDAPGAAERPPLPLHVPHLEKLLGELHRVSASKDCNDNLLPKSKSSVSMYSKVLAVRTVGNLLTLIDERANMLALLSPKCVSGAVVAACRYMVSCRATALYFFSTPAVVHAASLLHHQLGKDLSDPKEMNLAKQLADLISVSLDPALCNARLRSPEDETDAAVCAVRARAHNLTSYLCLSGVIARAEHAGEARERVQTLVTLCADLCQPQGWDAGPERASALQSLRCALGTSLMGARAEFCMLFAEGAELSRSQNFVRAARTAHLLRQIAEMDHTIVQDAFGEGGWPLEFRAAVARLLSQHAPNDKEAPLSDVLNLSNQRLDLTLSEQMVVDLIVLVGFVVVNNPQLHETICENWSVVKTLCTLPANWLVSENHCHYLLPTLVVLAEHARTGRVIFDEINMKLLENYVNSPKGRKMKLIQVLKSARDKAAKREKQGKKETQDAENQNDSTKQSEEVIKDKTNIANGTTNVDKVILTNGDVKLAKNGIGNDSDTENQIDEV